MDAQALMDLGGGVGIFGTLLIGAISRLDCRKTHESRTMDC